ncbi:MAG: zinc-ribbon domain-containing protein, partial [Chloroflexota bacterium]
DDEERRFCPQCGKPVEGDDRFCEHCGARLR